MNEPIQLVANKPDKELAEEFKQELASSIEPYLQVLTKVHKAGFQVQMSCGMNLFGQAVIQQLTLVKQF